MDLSALNVCLRKKNRNVITHSGQNDSLDHYIFLKYILIKYVD